MGLRFPPSPGAGFHQGAALEKWEEATGAFLTSYKCPFHPHSVVTRTEPRAFKIHMLKSQPPGPQDGAVFGHGVVKDGMRVQ